MPRPWKILDAAKTPDGLLELKQRGEQDFLITIDNRVLMNSSASRSEQALGESARRIAGGPNPRVLIGGLGMALTLRAALDVLPETAEVLVAELNPIIETWCRTHLAALTGSAVLDKRVVVEIQDVSTAIRRAAERGGRGFDAIIIDLYEGPHPKTDPVHDPFYGSRAISGAYQALADHGVFAVWGENPDQAFEQRLAAAGFTATRARPGRGGLRHVVYIAEK